MTHNGQAHIDAARTTIDALAKAHGLEAEELLMALHEDVGGGITVREYYDDTWADSVAGTRKTAKTYRNAVKPLAHGIRLEKVFRRPGAAACEVKPWDDGRAEHWLSTASTINDDRELGLSIPTIDVAQRSPDGGIIVWAGLGDRPMRALTGTEMRHACDWVELRARTTAETKARPRATNASRAVEGLLIATRNMFERAEDDLLVPRGTDPTRRIPRRSRSTEGLSGSVVEQQHRDVFTDAQHGDLRLVWCCCGNDTDLDTALFTFFEWTGSRRAGAIRLEMRHLDRGRQLVAPPDKNSEAARGKPNWVAEGQPVPKTVMDRIIAHAVGRGARDPRDRVFRYADGSPLTDKRFDTISDRCRDQLDFVAELDEFGPHHLRSRVAGLVERTGGRAAKDRFLRHKPANPGDRYGRASLVQLAEIIEQLSGEWHPAAHGD